MFDFLLTTPYAWVVPYITVAITVCGAIDGAFPQPKPGSHWLLIRKPISFIAMNFGNAKNANQPPFASWALRMLRELTANLPTPAAVAAPGPGAVPAAQGGAPVAQAPAAPVPTSPPPPLAPQALAPVGASAAPAGGPAPASTGQ